MFCRIYVNGYNLSVDNLLSLLSNFLGSNIIDDSYIEKDGYEIDISKNDEFIKEEAVVFPDGFIHFPYFIEIEINEQYVKDPNFRLIGSILTFLWEKGISAIASCSFESILPENGGYNNGNIPWVKQ